MSNTNEKTFKRKQNELLRNTLCFMAAELADVEESLHHENSAFRMGRCNQAKLRCPVPLRIWEYLILLVFSSFF